MDPKINVATAKNEDVKQGDKEGKNDGEKKDDKGKDGKNNGGKKKQKKKGNKKKQAVRFSSLIGLW